MLSPMCMLTLASIGREVKKPHGSQQQKQKEEEQRWWPLGAVPGSKNS